jgi:predicted RNase H-like HicB family nuclease
VAGSETRDLDGRELEVAAMYSRSKFWPTTKGEVLCGCYVLRLRRFSWQHGIGETVEEALGDLATALRYWLESFDEYEPPEDYPGEPPVFGAIRDAVRRGDLLDELRAGLGQAVLDPVDEPTTPAARASRGEA